MTPLGSMVAGLGLVVLDFRLEGFDLLPDVIGWGVVLAGLMRLAGRSPWFTAAGVGAGLGVLLGIPLLVVEAGRALSTMEALVFGVVVFGTCTGIRETVESSRVQGTANVLRWSHLCVNILGALATVLVAPTVVTGTGVPVLLLAAVAVLGLMGWLLVFLWTNRADPALSAPRSTSQPDPVG